MKRLVLHFLHDASWGRISDARKEGFEKNGAKLATLRDRMKRR
jgi:hypothetical protein